MCGIYQFQTNGLNDWEYGLQSLWTSYLVIGTCTISVSHVICCVYFNMKLVMIALIAG